MRYEFKTNVTDNSYYGFADILMGRADHGLDVDITTTHLQVEYTLDMDVRDYGIKSVDISVGRVILELEWSCSTEEMTDGEKETLTKAGGIVGRDLAEGRWMLITKGELDGGWNIKSDDLKMDGSLTINEVEVDFKRKIINIS